MTLRVGKGQSLLLLDVVLVVVLVKSLPPSSVELLGGQVDLLLLALMVAGMVMLVWAAGVLLAFFEMLQVLVLLSMLLTSLDVLKSLTSVVSLALAPVV